MSELSECFKVLKEDGKQRRANNRKNSADMLANSGISFESKNGGAHLIVEGRSCLIDFWPGTGKWNARDGKRGFGVKNLIVYIKRE